MTTFDDRDKSFENKFAHDRELMFKVTARRNKLLGLWAAERLGKKGNEASDYARELVLAEFENAKNNIAEKLMGDFAKAGVGITEREIKREMETLLPVAREEIMGSNGK